MTEIKRTLLVHIPHLAEAAQVLTGRGTIVGIDHEGTITYELSGEDEFELGRVSYEVEHELETLACGHGSKILSVRQVAAIEREAVKREKKAAGRPRKAATT